MKKYYEAYDLRYQIVHKKGMRWLSEQCTPIVLETIIKYGVNQTDKLLEIGCGEGRDAKAVLEAGYDLCASDISKEAIAFCKQTIPNYHEHFEMLDCLCDEHERYYDFIYAVALVHMFVLDEDRDRFYSFIFHHLKEKGIALICSMGDGQFEMQSDIDKAFDLQKREHESGRIMVTNTSCRMVSFETFKHELERNGLMVIEKGITSSLPDFNSLMYAVVKKSSAVMK